MDQTPQDWREYRRFRALALHEQGRSGTEIAEVLGVTTAAVSQWLVAAREHGKEALRSKKAPGATPKLTSEQFALLPKLLERSPEEYGFSGEVWSCPRVVELVKREFGVSYHAAHMSRILKRLGLTPQKPIRRASQRDEEAIAAWREERWPELKRSRRERGAP